MVINVNGCHEVHTFVGALVGKSVYRKGLAGQWPQLLRIDLHDAKRNYNKKGKDQFGMRLYPIN